MRWMILLIAIGYAALRYAWAAGVPAVNWPAYITNKALAFAAVALLVLGLWQYRRDGQALPERAGLHLRWALTLAIAHAFISAVLLGPGYLPFLADAEGMGLNVLGELTVLGGGLTLGVFITQAIRRTPRTRAADLLLLGILLGHVVAVGILKWIDPTRWAYGLVPISLCSAVLVVIGLVICLRRTLPATLKKPS